MGGFFLLCSQPSKDRTIEFRRLAKAFAELDFATPEVIRTDTYVIAAYPNFQSSSPAVKHYPNGDFVFVSGTCFTQCAIGVAAAELLCNDAEKDCMGHYAAVLKKKDRTEIRLDRFGGYQLFYNRALGVVSSSFYAICSVLPTLTLTQQAVCEYVFNGVVSGNETLFSEVALPPIGATIVVDDRGLEIRRSRLSVIRKFGSEGRAASLDQSVALLDRYFASAVHHFGDRVNCALSGGYDSRLMLACLRRHRANPRVYVYGRKSEKDVQFALHIAKREGFPLDIIDKSDRPIIPPAAFNETAHQNFLAVDGYHYAGIFHNGAEISESARRVRDNAIAFNGGGGEIFRNFFHLPDREYTIREILWSFYSRFDPASCTPAFDCEQYYEGLEKKITDLLGSDEQLLPRPTVEWLYHSFRCRSWDGKVDSIASRYGYTAMPYLERSITQHASGLRLVWKNHGAYEAELIRRMDSRLAAYPSIYGHDFSQPPPPMRRFADYATYLRPPWLRRYTYRVKHVWRRSVDRPGYLARAYRDAILPCGPVILRRLFLPDRISDDAQYSRILSLEYALRLFGSRVAPDF